jgi:flagellar motility protein MotE (MotC chaperone)
MAQKLGVSTDSIQRLDFAAQQTGVDLDKVARAILKMQGELAHGGWDKEKYASALNTLKLKPEDLVGKSPEDVLVRLADAFKQVADSAEVGAGRGAANAAIVSLIGIKMAGVIPLLSRGGAALREFFGRAPIAAQETINAMKQLSQQIGELGRVSFPVISKFVEGFAFVIKGVIGAGAVFSSFGGIVASVFELIRSRNVRAFREDITKIEDDLYAVWDKLNLGVPTPGNGNFVDAEKTKSAEQERHERVMENLDAELRHLLEVNRTAGQAEEKELEERKARLKELDDEYARLEQQPRTMERDEEMKQSDVAYLKQVNAIAELEQRIARQKQETAEALAKKTQDVEDARFQNSLILMSTEEKRLALLQREFQIISEIAALRRAGKEDAAVEREKDLTTLQAEELRLGKKGDQQSSNAQPFSVFTNELQRRGGAGAAVVGYGGGNEILNVAKQQLTAQQGMRIALETFLRQLTGGNMTGPTYQ